MLKDISKIEFTINLPSISYFYKITAGFDLVII